MSAYSTIFLDLDDTLYPADSGLWEVIGERIVRFVEERLSLSRSDAHSLRKRYTQAYGTTLKGLMKHHGVDAQEYMQYVHDVPVGQLLHPDPALKRMLSQLPQEILVFTNADRKHAKQVLDALGLGSEIKDVIGYFELEPHNKPEPEAYAKALHLAGDVDPRACVYADDQLRNLEPAAQLGMTTVLVGTNSPAQADHRRIARIDDLIDAVPDLVRPQGSVGHDAGA